MSQEEAVKHTLGRVLFLKIKLKSLVDEARIIRKEERKIPKEHAWLRNEMREHRVGVVRSASRSTHLAYGLARGLEYSVMEKKAECVPDWKAIDKMLASYQNSWTKEQREAVISKAQEDFLVQYQQHYSEQSVPA